jgi:hypothetical protein
VYEAFAKREAMAIERMLGWGQIATADMASLFGGSLFHSTVAPGGPHGDRYLQLNAYNAALLYSTGTRAPTSEIWGSLFQYIDSNGYVNFVKLGLYSDNPDAMWTWYWDGADPGPHFLRVVTKAGGTWTSTTPVFPDSWHTISFQVKIHASAGWFKVWIDGVLDLEASGINTAGAGEAVVSRVYAWGYNSFFDDIVLGNPSGVNVEPPNPFARVDCHFPVANGSHRAWARSGGADDYTLIDDVGLTAGTGEYLESTASGDRTTLRVEAFKLPGGSIYAVQVTAYLTKLTIGAATVRPYMLRDGWRHYGSVWAPTWNTWDCFSYVWDEDPAAGPGPWTEANFNASEFGIERL